MTMKKVILLAILTLLLAACASSPTIMTNVSPDADFRNFKTYGFMRPLGTDRSSGVQTPLSSRLMSSMSREMEARGLTRSDSPDLLIDFAVFSEDRIDVRQTPASRTTSVHRSSSIHRSSTVHRTHWHHGWTVWPTYETTVRQYTQGSLLIDLMDPATSVLIAEGGAQSRVTSSSQFTQQDVDDVVGRIMAGIWAK